MGNNNDAVTSDAVTPTPAPASSPSPKNTAPTSEKKFTVGKLRAHCRKLFDVSTSAFDGATSSLKGTYTIEQMKKIINDWGNKPIAPTKKKEDK